MINNHIKHYVLWSLEAVYLMTYKRSVLPRGWSYKQILLLSLYMSHKGHSSKYTQIIHVYYYLPDWIKRQSNFEFLFFFSTKLLGGKLFLSGGKFGIKNEKNPLWFKDWHSLINILPFFLQQRYLGLYLVVWFFDISSVHGTSFRRKFTKLILKLAIAML